jgi:hypothetical protein
MLLLGRGSPVRDVSGLSCEWREGHEWRDCTESPEEYARSVPVSSVFYLGVLTMLLSLKCYVCAAVSPGV